MTPETAAILAFLARIGIPVDLGPFDGDALIPGLDARHGRLLCDLDRLEWPGDLLHEAGHLAVIEPGARAGTAAVGDDPAEEMAALAWSYAAALAVGIDPAIVFHAGGYHGGGDWLIPAFAGNSFGPGEPMLVLWGMTLDRRAAARDGMTGYPHMLRWLR